MDLVHLRRVVEVSQDNQLGAMGRLSALVDASPEFRAVLGRYLEGLRQRAFGDERSVGALGPVITGQIAMQQMVVLKIEGASLPSFVRQALWQDALVTCGAARLIAPRMGCSEETAATLGLILHLGTVELLAARPYYMAWHREIRAVAGEDRRLAEIALFGRSRLDALREVAPRLALPPRVVQDIVDAFGEQEAEGLPLVLHYADRLAWATAGADAADRLAGWVAEAGMGLGWSDRAVRIVLQDVAELWSRHAGVLGVDDVPAAVALGGKPLESAGRNREVAEHALRMEREVARLRETLQRGWDTDPITELPTQRKFLRDLESFVAEAQRQRRDLWVLAIDLDGFTELNARHGFDAGDQVLSAVAGALGHLVPEGGAAARVGADSFAVAVTTDARGVKVLAQRVRVSIEELRFAGPLQALRVTASVHVVHLAGMERVSDGTGLYAAAMRALTARERRAANHVAWVN